MQPSLLAGAAVVVVAIVLAAIFWTGGEDGPPAQKTAASDTAASESGAPESGGEAPAASAQGQATEGEDAAVGAAPEQVTIREVPRAGEAGGDPSGADSGAGPSETAEAAESGEAGSQTAAVPAQETPEETTGATPEAAAAPMTPRFDIVRVEPSGESVIAGRAEPGSEVVLLDGEEEIARAIADPSGSWAIVVARPLEPGDHQLGLRAEMPDGSVHLSETLVIVSVPEPPLTVAGGERGGDQQVAVAAESEAPLAVETQREGLAATRVLQQPEDGGLRDQALLLGAVDYDADGYLVISGRAEPGARVVVYLDEQPLGTVVADADGFWQLAPEAPVASGLHRLRVDQLDDGGQVLARVATLFSRAELAGGFPEDRYVIVQPGNSLWRIARRTYGEGVQYSVIFQANDDQIADPDLIYPGQIFLVPSTN